MKALAEFVNKHGSRGVIFEQFLYRMADNFSEDYDGGCWESKKATEDESWFYLGLNDNKTYKIRNTANYYDSGDMDAKTFSLAIFAFACNVAGTDAHYKGMTELSEDLFELFRYCQRNAHEILGDDVKLSQYHWFLD